jgi:hypothetical protein
MALNWCRVFLEKDNQVQNWMSDRAIQSLVKRKDLNRDLWQLMREINQISPDAFFVYRGEMWLFEYEATQKNKTKYEHKAKSLVWFNTKDICWVIFVAATSGLKAILQTHFSHQRCVFFTFEELKQGKVNQFLIDRWQQVDQEEAERKHFHEQKKREAEKQLPGLKIQLEQLEMAKKSNQPEMEKAEKLWEEAFSTLNRFESGLIKLPGQRESLKEKLRVLREQYTALKKKDWELSKEITTQQHKIRELE